MEVSYTGISKSCQLPTVVISITVLSAGVGNGRIWLDCRNVRTCETSFNLSLNGRKDDRDVQVQARCGPQAAGAPTR